MQKEQLTNQDYINLSALLLRVDLKGNEALPVAQLQLKINSLIEKEDTSKKNEEEKTDNPE